MRKTREFNIPEILFALMDKMWLVIVAAMILGIGSYIYTANFMTPMYRASVVIYVNNTNAVDAENNGQITSSDLATSQRLVETYVTILKQRYSLMQKVADQVKAQTGVRPSEGSILSMMDAKALNETEVFQVSISHKDPKMATVIANAIADIAPGEIEDVIIGSSTKIVDYARVPSSPYTPNRTRNAIYGAMAGAAAAIAYIVLRVLLDVRIKSEEDLMQISNAPVLGVIPNFESEDKGSYTYESKQPNTNNKAVR